MLKLLILKMQTTSNPEIRKRIFRKTKASASTVYSIRLLPALGLAIVTLGLLNACSSADSSARNEAPPSSTSAVKVDTIENRVDLSESDKPSKPSKVYGDTIKAVSYNNNEGILISGKFANGCTYLKNVTYKASGDTLAVILEGRQPKDVLCTQALKPFQYFDTTQTAEWQARFSTFRFVD